MSGASPDFDEFFTQVHGRDPFPWQRRLADSILQTGRWPALLDLPTGTGKTAALDIALFTLAYRPDVLPRRVVMVVDRRVVVDQGADRARKLRKELRAATTGAAADVAARLRATFSGRDTEEPFSVAVLRGGMPRDEAWAHRPDVPSIVLSTVDQVGSRLLFRGYGVSSTMAPVHAGLLGNDCLYLLDEVQLSTAFAETLVAIRSRWRGWHARTVGRALPDRWNVVPMSATPIGVPADAAGAFRLDSDDKENVELARRLSACKVVALKLVRVAGDEERRADTFAEACADALRDHVRRGARASAVVVNRVATARAVYRKLREDLGQDHDVVLLTGRMRPLDRARIVGRADDPTSPLSRIAAGRDRALADRPVVVVATQSIEAGADFDFDALVTECASLDALRQRFGRLDRLGALGTSRADILVRHDQVGERADDVVYGAALSATWQWLETRAALGALDFGNAQFEEPPPDVAERVYSQVVHAPILLPAHIDAWAQTNPSPEPNPEVALWLHGPGRGVPEVRVVWRADVRVDDLADEEANRAKWEAQFGVAPPSSLEALSLPLPAVRAWLSRSALTPVADVEGTAQQDTPDAEGQERGGRKCLLVSRTRVNVRQSDELYPDATIVVPSTYGGIAAGNWDPEADAPVTDLGDLAQLLHRGRVVSRLDPDVWEAECDESADASWRNATVAAYLPLSTGDESAVDLRSAVVEWLEAHVVGGGPLARAVRDTMLEGGRRRRITLIDIGGRVAVVASKRVDPKHYMDIGEDRLSDVVADDDESGSFIGAEVTLGRHLNDVAVLAQRFATNLGLPDDVTGDLRCAASLHDVGKADPRFQQMLAGGSEVRLALQEALLAKSQGEPRDRAARQQARLRSGYPDAYRHELLSVAMLEQAVASIAPERDPDLVLHLVASHHGWCRPFAPANDPGPSLEVRMRLDGHTLHADAAHRLARFDSGIADRYFRLTERYGWWGLAWLEAILRLADHRASEAAQAEQSTEGFRG